MMTADSMIKENDKGVAGDTVKCRMTVDNA